MYNRKNNVPFASRRELVWSIALACFNITAFGLFCEFTTANKAVVAVCVVLIYLLEITALGVLRQKQQNAEPTVGMHEVLQETSSTVIKNTNQPIATFDEDGKILWCNDAMLKVLKFEENPIGMTIEGVFGTVLSSDKFGGSKISFKNRLYSAESFVLANKSHPIYMLSLTDVTALSEMEQRYNENKVCIAYIAIDNIEDVLQYVHEKFRVAVSRVDEKLKTWADSLGATIKSYDNDKYISNQSDNHDRCHIRREHVVCQGSLLALCIFDVSDRRVRCDIAQCCE